MNNKKTSFGGIEANIVAILCYLGALFFALFIDTKALAWLIPLIIYIVEKDNEFVKKNAAQSCVMFFMYAMFSILITFVSIELFNTTDIYSLNLTNFTGSLLLASTISMVARLVLVIVSIFSVIVSSKVCHYENYDIPFVNHFVKSFRKFTDSVINGNNKKENADTSDAIKEEVDKDISVEVEETKKEEKKDAVVLESDTEFIDVEEIKEKIKEEKEKKSSKKEVDK